MPLDGPRLCLPWLAGAAGYSLSAQEFGWDESSSPPRLSSGGADPLCPPPQHQQPPQDAPRAPARFAAPQNPPKFHPCRAQRIPWELFPRGEGARGLCRCLGPGICHQHPVPAFAGAGPRMGPAVPLGSRSHRHPPGSKPYKHPKPRAPTRATHPCPAPQNPNSSGHRGSGGVPGCTAAPIPDSPRCAPAPQAALPLAGPTRARQGNGMSSGAFLFFHSQPRQQITKLPPVSAHHLPRGLPGMGPARARGFEKPRRIKE